MSEVYKCDGCGREFPSKKSLSAHKWRCDPEKEEQRRRDAEGATPVSAELTFLQVNLRIMYPIVIDAIYIGLL